MKSLFYILFLVLNFAICFGQNNNINNLTNTSTQKVFLSAACANEDFEDAQSNTGPQIGGTVNGWTLTGDTSANYCTPSATAATNLYTVFNSPTIDPYMVAPTNTISSYFDATSVTQPAGNCFVRLNNAAAGAKVVRLSKSYILTPSNALFKYAYRAVLSNPGHACCQQPGVQIKVTLTNTVTSTSTLLACPQISIAAGTSCGPAMAGFVTGNLLNGSLSSYNPSWMTSSIDLSTSIGLSVTIDVYAIDCNQFGHAGYVYFDSQCAPLDILGNGYPNSAVGSNITIPACSSGSIALSLPSGLGTYSWAGLGVVSPYNTALVSNQNYTATAPGIYTLTINPNGACAPITKTINITLAPSTTINATGINTVCAGSSANFTLSGGSSYSVNSVAVSSNPVNILSPTSAAFTVSGINSFGCLATGSLSIITDTTCSDVWPGDANSDGICNNLDVLELGLHFTSTGAVRTVTSNLWQSYFSNNWAGTISNGKNLNHSDCNGDGIINLNDSLAIYNNYNSTHTFKENSSTLINPQLHLVSDQSFVNKGNWGSVSILLADSINPITSINGIAFNLSFEKNYVETDSVNISYPLSFLNSSNANFNFKKTDFASGVIYAASTHTNNINTSGYGKIATFYFKVNSNLNLDTVLRITISQANKSNSSGLISSITAGTVGVVIKGAIVGIKKNSLDNNEILVYPNPTKNFITISSKNEMQKISILNITGQTLKSEVCKSNSVQVNLELFPKGMYFLKIYDTNGFYSIKPIIIKD